MFPDIKGLLDSKLKEADKKFEPQGGLAVMMTTVDHAALEFMKVLASNFETFSDQSSEEIVKLAYIMADKFVAEKKARTKSS